MAAERALLLSIRPAFADAILRQEKTIELRRTRLHVPAGTRVVLYSSTPVKSIVGVATLTAIEEGSPEELWQTTAERSALERPEYDEYFRGARRAFGLHLSDVTRLHSPVPLSTLRATYGVEPPQSFRYLTNAQADELCASASLPRQEWSAALGSWNTALERARRTASPMVTSGVSVSHGMARSAAWLLRTR